MVYLLVQYHFDVLYIRLAKYAADAMKAKLRVERLRMTLCVQEDLRPRLSFRLGNGRIKQPAADAMAALLALNRHTPYLPRGHQARAPKEIVCFRMRQKMRTRSIKRIHLLGLRHTLLAHENLSTDRF